ncbi:MAG TPA: hypothetical protein VNO50_03790 [Pyrinomonadaceae bacterium]|nr:hypothetical protein [Pyrinomonadaceae bacterium]
MRTLCLFVACLVLVPGVGSPALAQFQDAPSFDSFKVAVWRGRIAPLNLNSHPLARKFRTGSREQIKEAGVNFAGRYTLVSLGCGTGCAINGFVDARTGRAYFPNEFIGWTGIVGDYDPPEGEDSWTYRADSRLLRAVGRPNIGRPGEERYGPSGIYYYEWTRNRLRLVKFIPVGSYPKADPPVRR